MNRQAIAIRGVPSSLLFGVLACCLALPRILTEPFGVHLPGFPPYLPTGAIIWGPLIAMVTLTNWRVAYDNRGMLVRIEDTDVGFFACVAVWLFLELIHAVLAATEPDVDLILQVAWLQLFYVAIRSFHYIPNIGRSVVRYSILLITAGCAIEILALLQVIPSNIPAFEPFHERPLYSFVNRGAFLAAFGITLIYFFSDIRRQSVLWQLLLHACAMVNLAFLLLSQSRGATVVLGLALLAGVMAKLAPRVRRNAAAFGVLTGVAIVILGLSTPALRDISLYNRSFEEGGSTRLEMIRVGATVFVDHPLSGVGLTQANEYRVEGYEIHTSYALGLMAYGLLGAVCLLFFIAGFRPRWLGTPGHVIPVALVLLIGSMTFLPYIPWWYAVLGYIVREHANRPASG